MLNTLGLLLVLAPGEYNRQDYSEEYQRQTPPNYWLNHPTRPPKVPISLPVFGQTR
jgi:hypothetical protein